MQIDKSIRSNNKEVDEYIEQLEEALLTSTTSNINKLIKSADELAGVIADDMSLIIKGEKEGLVLLSSDSTDKLTERMMLILKNIQTFKDVADTAKSMQPTVKDEVREEVNPQLTDLSIPLIEQLPRKNRLK